MQRIWLSDRVRNVQEASKRYEASQPPVDCMKFLKAFERQLHDQLHLKHLIGSSIPLPIQRGCFPLAVELMKANGVVVKDDPSDSGCECAQLFLRRHQLHFACRDE